MGFSLEDDNLGERLANNISLFLSALALLYVVGQDLPKTTFLTAIDRIVVVTLSLIFVTSVHFVLLNYQAHEDNSKQNLGFLDTNETSPTNINSTSTTNMGNDVSTKHVHDYKLVLAYFFGYIIYIALEFIVLVFRRYKQCKNVKKNLDKHNVFLDGVEEHNKNLKEDITYKTPAYLMIDPFRLILMKKGDSRALLLPQLLTKVAVPVQLFLPSSGKAVVMSARPGYKHDGKDVHWMTIGSPLRALEVVFDIELYIRVRSNNILLHC